MKQKKQFVVRGLVLSKTSRDIAELGLECGKKIRPVGKKMQNVHKTNLTIRIKNYTIEQ